MSERSAGSSKAGKGKKPHKNKPTSKKYSHYVISGENIKRARQCVKCGAGVFMAAHKDRFSCGKCGYSEFATKAVKE